MATWMLNTMEEERKTKKKKKQNTVPTAVKHGGRNIMVWGCLSCQGTRNLVKGQGIMRKENYIQIFDEKLKKSTEKLQFGGNWKLQQGKDLTHAKVA